MEGSIQFPQSALVRQDYGVPVILDMANWVFLLCFILIAS